jgi:hypothetical protein
MPIDPPVSRGTAIGEQIGGRPLSGAEHFRKYPLRGRHFERAIMARCSITGSR